MTTVYLVVQGEYSDFRVEGVFSTRKKAQRLVDVLEYYPEIYEYTLDEFGDAPVKARYDVKIHPETSQILDVERIGEFGTESPRVVVDKNFRYSVFTEMFGEKGTFSALIDVYRAVVYAKDEEHARKAATDAVAKYKAEEENL